MSVRYSYVCKYWNIFSSIRLLLIHFINFLHRHELMNIFSSWESGWKIEIIQTFIFLSVTFEFSLFSTSFHRNTVLLTEVFIILKIFLKYPLNGSRVIGLLLNFKDWRSGGIVLSSLKKRLVFWRAKKKLTLSFQIIKKLGVCKSFHQFFIIYSWNC